MNKTAAFTNTFVCFTIGLLLVCPFTYVRAQINAGDSLALVDLYNSTNGKSWIFRTNWLSKEPVGKWYGVTADVTGTRVLKIDLNNNSLTGTLPASLGNITYMDQFDVTENEVGGSIPSTLGNLVYMYELKLNHNFFEGSIPASFGNLTNLVYLLLNENRLSGSIPSSLGSMTSLVDMELHDNQLTGSIPASFGNLSNLYYLNLYNNHLSGSIPSSIGSISNLVRINLDSNQLSGTIPPELGSLPMLSNLFLADNKLSGAIPPELANTDISILDLSHNQLSGGFPEALTTIHDLVSLDLSANQLTGVLPSSLPNLLRLGYLDLSHNGFGGPIPSSFGSFYQIYHVDLSSNALTDSVPASLNSLRNTRYFSIANNRLTGVVPTGIGQGIRGQIDSAYLYLQNNAFTFTCTDPVVTATTNDIGFFIYAPQAHIPLYSSGGTLWVSAGGTLTNDTFHWYRDGVPEAVITGDSTYQPVSGGRYSVAVTNNISRALTLYSDTLSLSALPITLVHFSASLQQQDVTLSWQTANGENLSSFTVLRSTDGVHFTETAKVSADGKEHSSYSVTDAVSSLSSVSTIYYQLQIADKNAGVSFSQIIHVSSTAVASKLFITPNPATSQAVITYSFGDMRPANRTLEVYAPNGIRMQQVSVAAAGTYLMPVSHMVKGTYYVVMKSNLQKVKVATLIVR